MRAARRSEHHFNVRSRSGAVLPPTPRFSSGLLVQAGGAYAAVDDEQVISAALRICRSAWCEEVHSAIRVRLVNISRCVSQDWSTRCSVAFTSTIEIV
jgi:hypothetical protein